MSKSLKYFVIGIAIASIASSAFELYRGVSLIDASSGAIIGFALLASVFYETSKKKKSDY